MFKIITEKEPVSIINSPMQIHLNKSERILIRDKNRSTGI